MYGKIALPFASLEASNYCRLIASNYCISLEASNYLAIVHLGSVGKGQTGGHSLPADCTLTSQLTQLNIRGIDWQQDIWKS
jgi:hypothetical protein